MIIIILLIIVYVTCGKMSSSDIINNHVNNIINQFYHNPNKTGSITVPRTWLKWKRAYYVKKAP
jgi:hypothetical protein